jgi:hypothetical protein
MSILQRITTARIGQPGRKSENRTAKKRHPRQTARRGQDSKIFDKIA